MDQLLAAEIENARERIFRDPRAQVGTNTTYILDLYARAGRAYRDLLRTNYERLKSSLLSNHLVQWFFISGGYGIVHALERGRKYQATFNRIIADQKSIPHTTEVWTDLLPVACDKIVSKFQPDFTYVFGSRDYTQFVKQTEFWKIRKNVEMFESTGTSGSHWLSPIIAELVESILDSDIETFNKHYSRFTKQK